MSYSIPAEWLQDCSVGKKTIQGYLLKDVIEENSLLIEKYALVVPNAEVDNLSIGDEVEVGGSDYKVVIQIKGDRFAEYKLTKQ